ncbi:hypothetical protein [Flavobacterium sp.]|uniref:hypothetical protein n=1 Tax=Flavobacterium sp. TaxID=239 RepID=UPI00262BD298|nr:hypothetical protein [Flavobacterium sp.]
MKNTTIAILIASLLSGCVSPVLQSSVQQVQQRDAIFVENQFRKVNPVKNQFELESSQEVSTPYLAGKAVPLSRNVSLPLPLRKGVTTAVLFPDTRVSLSTAGERIMLATGLNVAISPDVYIDDSQLLPKNSQSSISGAQKSQPLPVTAAQPLNPNGAPPLPDLGPGVALGNANFITKPQQDTPYSFEFPKVEAPLAQILDLISVRLGIKWKFEESTNTVRFYRLVTKTWETPFTASVNDYTTKFEDSGATSTNSNTLSLKSGNPSVSSELKGSNEIESIVKNLEVIMSKSGNISANRVTGSITMIDTADAIDNADAIIKKEVRALSRTVTLNVRTIQLTTTDESSAGLDINAIVNAALSNMPAMGLTTQSPGSVVGANPGSLGISILSGQANGTTAFIKALRQYGKTDVSQEIPLQTRNRRAVSYNILDTFSYLSGTTPGIASLSGGGTPGLQTSQDQVGLKLMIFPNVTNTGNVNLDVSLDQSILKGIVPFTSGSGINQQTVQNVNKSKENSTQSVTVRTGETMILTGFDKRTNQFDKRTLGENAPIIFGGSASGSRDRITTIVLLSVKVSDVENQ